jgi:hypothetical protein
MIIFFILFSFNTCIKNNSIIDFDSRSGSITSRFSTPGEEYQHWYSSSPGADYKQWSSPSPGADYKPWSFIPEANECEGSKRSIAREKALEAASIQVKSSGVIVNHKLLP